MSAVPECDDCYAGDDGQVSWRGKTLTDENESKDFLRGPVRERLLDEKGLAELTAELRQLATTGMASEALEQFLSIAWDGEPWQVGESLAECLLESQLGVQWPWNMERDKRTPKASLQGADLVGFLIEDKQVHLVLGEVKTSGDVASPPNVMTGRTGMITQLEQLASDKKLRWTLIKWLQPLFIDSSSRRLFKKAMKRFLESQGSAIILIGCLMRDTQPSESDLRARGRALARTVITPMRADLYAWYVPHAIDSWTTLLEAEPA